MGACLGKKGDVVVAGGGVTRKENSTICGGAIDLSEMGVGRRTSNGGDKSAVVGLTAGPP